MHWEVIYCERCNLGGIPLAPAKEGERDDPRRCVRWYDTIRIDILTKAQGRRLFTMSNPDQYKRREIEKMAARAVLWMFFSIPDLPSVSMYM